MTVNSLDIGKRATLVRFGFSPRSVSGTGMMVDGFDDHRVVLYCHSERPNQIKEILMRIGNPAQIDNAEADYLVNKMKSGYFPWTKEECLDRTFQLEWNSQTRGKVYGPEQKGCQWCHERNNKSGSTRDVAGATPEQVQETAVIPEFPVSQTPATPSEVTFNEVVCTDCGWIAELQTRAGKPRSAKQRKNALRMHVRVKHKAARS